MVSAVEAEVGDRHLGTSVHEQAGGLAGRRPSTIIFAVVAFASVPVLLWYGRHQWFFYDEWTFLSDRTMAPADLLADHNGHWVTTPLIAFRALYAVVGIHTYLPYQVLVVVSHILVATLLRQMMVRLQVKHWVATALAIAFIFFGAGNQNIFFAFQITLNGALILGLTQFLLTDHPGDRPRRDRLAVGAAVLGLTMSAVAIPLIVGVGVAVALRRGLRAAATQTVVPGLLYGAWYLLFNDDESSVVASAGPVVKFGSRSAGATFWALGQHRVAAVVIAGAAVVGVVAVVRHRLRLDDHGRFATAAGLGASWFLFIASVALSRSALLETMPQIPESSRYLHTSLALVLPFIGVGTEALMGLARPLAAIPLVAVVAGVPGNLEALANPSPFTLGNEHMIVAMANSEYVDDVPDDLEIVPGLPGHDLTAGWLEEARRNGKVPNTDDVQRQTLLTADVLLTLRARPDAESTLCPTPQTAETWTLEAGDVVVHDHSAITVTRSIDGTTGAASRFTNRVVEVLAGPIEVKISRPNGDAARVCVGPE